MNGDIPTCHEDGKVCDWPDGNMCSTCPLRPENQRQRKPWMNEDNCAGLRAPKATNADLDLAAGRTRPADEVFADIDRERSIYDPQARLSTAPNADRIAALEYAVRYLTDCYLDLADDYSKLRAWCRRATPYPNTFDREMR